MDMPPAAAGLVGSSSTSGGGGGAPLIEPNGLPPQAWAENAAADPQAEAGTCEGCRVSKVRCDRKRPCSRCIRLQHTCRPARKRPWPGAAMAGSPGEGPARGKRAARNSAAAVAAAAAAAAAGGASQGQQLCQALQEQLSGRELAEAMIQAVGRLAKDGRVDGVRARSTL